MSKVISKIVVPDSSELTGYALYNVKDANAIPASEKGVASGVATLDNTGKIPSSQIPSDIVSLLSDWNQTDSTAGDYIKNKPTIPSVGNAEIEIQKNGTKVGSFTTNQSGSKVTMNITVPTGTAANKDVPTSGNASTSQVVMGNDSRLTDSRNAKDVYSWAKESSKPTYTASEVGAIPTSAKGVASGVATLDTTGKVPTSQLPSYVDDVLEYTNKASFPTTGETGKIYVDKATNLTWRWGGSAYVEISPSLALGETSSTAYAGDKGKALADKLSTIAKGAEVNVQSDWNATSGDAFIKNKPTIPAAAANGTYTLKTLVGSTITNVSDFTANQSSADDVTFVQGSNVTITPDATNRKITIAAKDTTYSNFVKSGSGAKAGLVPAPPTTAGATKYLREDGTWQTPPDNNTWTAASISSAGYVPAATKGKFLHSNASTGNLEWVNDNNTTYTPQKLGTGIGTCSTSSGTALTVSLTGYELVQNGFVAVTFDYDVPANATLNVNGKGAKPIYYKGSAIEADTIKADDTALFSYNGTNYVLISSGSSGGGATQEFAVVSLKTDDDNNSVLVGATIVITDDDTSETILSTTWSGSDVIVGINGDVEYTITVGNVINYSTTNTQSYTAIAGLARQISFVYSYAEYVDLGLTSGIKWARKNVGANNSWDRGLYFSFGNIVGYAYNSGYNFDSSTYNGTPGASLNDSISSGSSNYDAARANMGGLWRTPSSADFAELIAETDHEWVSSYNGVPGMKFMKKTDHDAFIFLPAVGRYNGITNQYYNNLGRYSSTDLAANKTDSTNLQFSSSTLESNNYDYRYCGYPIRAII